MTNQRVLNISYFILYLLQDTTLSLSLSSLPYLNSLISEFFQHYETSMEADDVFLHGRNIVMCSHAPSKTTFYKFPLLCLLLGYPSPPCPHFGQISSTIIMQPPLLKGICKRSS